MGSLPFAFSVHHFINSVGSDAGFASIIGLAILILLYFAQARETASLRNHAQEAAQRIQELEVRLTQLGRAQPPAAAQAQAAQAVPARAQAAQAVHGAGRAVPEVVPAAGRIPAVAAPVAPAGVGAPALTAATRLIPASAPAAAPVALSPPQPADSTVIAAAAPATVAGGANGVAQGDGPPPPRPVSTPVSTQTPPPRIQIRPGGTVPPARRPPPPLRSQPSSGRGPTSVGKLLLAALGVLLLAGVIVLLLVLTGSSSSTHSTSSASRTTNTPGKKRSTRQSTVAPSSVTVAVLNGTATSGLAHRVALKLSGIGYKEGMVATAADQTRTTTTVAYLAGFRRDALAVAGALKLSSSTVQPVDQSTQAVACPPPAACPANVVVTVGSDLATTP